MSEKRQCTCHPDDNPPIPCEHRYAFRDCADAEEERYLREMLIPRVAPISPQLILCFIAEKVLGLPKSY